MIGGQRILRGFFVLALSAFFSVPAQSEVSVTLGVPDLPPTLNILTSDHPGAELLRRGVVGTLREASSASGIGLRVADRIEISPDGKIWRLRISPLARFTNGAVVTAGDVRYSLSRCSGAGMLPGVRSLLVEPASDTGTDGTSWLRLETEGNGSRPLGDRLLPALGRCPIVERSSSEVFGADLGNGSNLVSCGEYGLSELKAGRELSMRRLPTVRARAQAGGADLVTVRGFAEADGGLAALRAGTIDALVTAEGDIISRAKKDETLFALQCPIYTIVHRKGLQIDCLDRVIVSKIRYVG